MDDRLEPFVCLFCFLMKVEREKESKATSDDLIFVPFDGDKLTATRAPVCLENNFTYVREIIPIMPFSV